MELKNVFPGSHLPFTEDCPAGVNGLQKKGSGWRAVTWDGKSAKFMETVHHHWSRNWRWTRSIWWWYIFGASVASAAHMVSNSKGAIFYSPSRGQVTAQKFLDYLTVPVGRLFFSSITSLNTDHSVDPNFTGKSPLQLITRIPTSFSILIWTLEPNY